MSTRGFDKEDNDNFEDQISDGAVIFGVASGMVLLLTVMAIMLGYL